jgi:hypothetical protein
MRERRARRSGEGAASAFLLELARSSLWWQKPEEALCRSERVLAQVMDRGS